MFLKTGEPLPEWNPSLLDFIPGQTRWVVLDVIDGDSIVIRYKGKMKAAQLIHVNAPDLGKPFYQEARDYLSEMTKGDRVKMVFPERGEFETDFFGRYKAYFLKGSTNINRAMIESGWARVRDKENLDEYSRDFLKIEKQARAAELGIWSATEPPTYTD